MALKYRKYRLGHILEDFSTFLDKIECFQWNWIYSNIVVFSENEAYFGACQKGDNLRKSKKPRKFAIRNLLSNGEPGVYAYFPYFHDFLSFLYFSWKTLENMALKYEEYRYKAFTA